MQSEPTNALELPAPIAMFFTNELPTPQLARCFTEDAVVLDEGHAHRGRDAITAWNAAAVTKYAVVTEPLAAETHGARTTVRAKVIGTFPGSPIELRFHFTLQRSLIARLEIGA